MSTVTLEQLTALNDEIAALIRSGVPLELGLRDLARDSAGALQEISRSLAERMGAGASLPEALEAEQTRLPVAYRTVVEAGLRSGRLSTALEALSNHARELVELRRRISLALTYPLIVTVLAYLLFIVFVVNLLDRIRETYELFRIPTHWSLEFVLRCGAFCARWWWAPPLALAVVLVWWTSTGGARVLNFSGAARPLGWFPGVGRIGRMFRFANFADLLALMIEHQVPLPEALRLAGQAVGDARLARGARALADSVERGSRGIPGGGKRLGFPPFLYWALTSGQQNAGLARLLNHAGTIYRRRALSLSAWFKLTFPIGAALVIGGGVTMLYAMTLFGPLVGLWSDLGLD